MQHYNKQEVVSVAVSKKSEMSVWETISAKARRLWLAAVLAGATVFASLLSNNQLVKNFTEVLPTSSSLEWVIRSPGSFFVASPLFGEPLDALQTAMLVGLCVGMNEYRHGWKQTLRLVIVCQTIGCFATRLWETWGRLSPDALKMPDVGSSAVTVALLTKFCVETAQERKSRLAQIAWYAGAVALGVGTTIVYSILTGDITSAVAHTAATSLGWFYGTRSRYTLASKFVADAELSSIPPISVLDEIEGT
jgi:hypothetical protein